MSSQKYNRLYQDFTSRVAASAQHLESRVIESEKALITPLAENARIIYDLGTGIGRFPKYFVEQEMDAKIVGIESNWQMFLRVSKLHDSRVRFVHSDILDWLRSADEADLILCMGNTLGGLINEEYRNSVFTLVFERLHKDSYFVIDYRPIDAVLKEESVISRQPQKYGELIVTMEEVSGKKMELPQFYPDEQLLVDFIRSVGFRLQDIGFLDKTKYIRKALTLKKEGSV